MDAIKVLIEGITQDLVKYIVEDSEISVEEAMGTVYGSMIFEKLLDFKTGLYRESSSYIYELLQDELNEGKLVQKEF
jgi:hypothetical protein